MSDQFPSHPSHQAKFPANRGFNWVEPTTMLKPPKSGNNSLISLLLSVISLISFLHFYGGRWIVRTGVNLNTLRAERRRATGSAAKSREGTDGEPVRCQRSAEKVLNSDFSGGKPEV